MKEITIDETIYRIGQNDKDNTDLIKNSESEWFWFHLEKFPSCHVIICKNDISSEEIMTASQLVKDNSKYKFNNIGINYCKVKNLVHGDKAGSVSFVSNKQVKKISL